LEKEDEPAGEFINKEGNTRPELPLTPTLLLHGSNTPRTELPEADAVVAAAVMELDSIFAVEDEDGVFVGRMPGSVTVQRRPLLVVGFEGGEAVPSTKVSRTDTVETATEGIDETTAKEDEDEPEAMLAVPFVDPSDAAAI
jgi:hypothetical protein